MNIKFTKIEGLGNDYLFIDAINQDLTNIDIFDLSKNMSERHFGVGSDGIIILLPAENKDNDFRYRIINSDGSEAEMCGNGIRGFAKFIYDKGFSDKKILRIETLAGIIIPEIIELDESGKVKLVRVDMGEPIIEGKKIPSTINKEKVIEEKISVEGNEYSVNLISMGNPHCIIFKDVITDEDINISGPLIEKANYFPNRINVEFAKIKNRDEIDMRVWERGAAETLACGTGACAVGVAAMIKEKVNKKVTVHLLGGDLIIEWVNNNHVFMTGPTTKVFEGNYNYKV
jgi:diaminopimelate epimerase